MKTLGKIAVFLFIALTVHPVWAKENWTAYTYVSVPDSSAAIGLKDAVDAIGRDSGGNFKVSLFLGGTLNVKAADITTAVANGIVDMASDTINLDKDPAGGVLSLPMLVTTEHEWQAAMKAIEPYLKEGFTEQGLIYLGMYRYPAQTIFASFELNSATDLHGKKMRVTAPIQTALIEHFGGTAVTLDGVEVPQALQHGIVDGVLTASGGGAKKWHTFLKTNYRLSINYGCSVLIANRNSFERLPPEHQQALIKTFAEAGSKITKDFMADEKAQVEGQSSYGIKIIKADPADVASAQKAMEKVWAQWAEEKGPRAVKALAAVRVAIGK